MQTLVGERTEPDQVRRAEERHAVRRRESLTRGDLLGDGLQRRIGDARAVELDGVWHGYSSYRLTTSETLWPPKPALLLNAARTSRGRALFGVTSRSPHAGSGVQWLIVGGTT
jgi:hypothetical protein